MPQPHVTDNKANHFLPCRAVNALGEAICEAELIVGPGEGGEGGDLYLPELWKTGKRLTWKDEVIISRLSNIFLH